MSLQHRNFCACWNLTIFCLLLADVSLIHAEEQQQPSDQHPVFRWLQKEHPDDFYFNPKLTFQGDESSIQVQESLDESEILMVIPSSAVLSIEQLEEEMVEDIFCSLAARLWVELLNDKDDSSYAPYVQYIVKQHTTKEPTIPNFWSTIGKRLMGLVYGSYLRTDFLIDWVDDFEHCRDFLVSDNGGDVNILERYHGNDYTTIWNSNQDNARRHVMAMTAKRQIDQLLFVPLYDDIDHHLVEYNVKHLVQRRGEEYSVTVVTTQPISPGETLYRPSQACLFECVEPKQPIVLDILRNFGHVPPYPHYWEIPELELSFTIHGGAAGSDDNASSKPTLTWPDKPVEESQIEFLESKYRHLQDQYTNEVLKSVTSVPSNEWKVIEEYSAALQTALRTAIENGKDEIIISTSSDCRDDEDSDQDSIIRQEVGTGESECIVEEKVDVDPIMEGVDGAENKHGEVNDQKSQETEWDPWSITQTSCSNCTLEELEDSRGCGEYSFSTIHNESTWTHLRAAYVAVMGVENSTIQATYRSGIKVPFKIDHSPGRGRGVFAMEDIPKGTLVWSGQHTGAFTTGKQFRQFLSVLPDVLVCDLTNWCYTAEDASTYSVEDEDADDEDEEYKHVIECDLDEGSLINAYETKEEHNVGCTDEIVEDLDVCLENLYALRDVRKGEEFVTDYADFSTASWDDFGL